MKMIKFAVVFEKKNYLKCIHKVTGDIDQVNKKNQETENGLFDL